LRRKPPQLNNFLTRSNHVNNFNAYKIPRRASARLPRGGSFSSNHYSRVAARVAPLSNFHEVYGLTTRSYFCVFTAIRVFSKYGKTALNLLPKPIYSVKSKIDYGG
jgi:hypothetical protein